jgi:NAD(P)-dependent dehydrogenase (short-subunit alcohol dehydrogenase family)
MAKKIAVVTGGNRGLGLETCRQLARKGLHVVLTARDAGKAAQAVEKLRAEGLTDVESYALDVTQPSGFPSLREHLVAKHGRLDVLVNNAGVFLDPGWDEGDAGKALNAKPDTLRRSFETNTLGPFLLIQALAPLLRQTRNGCVVNLSSGMGQLTEMNGGSPGYRLSKTALNAVTRIFAEELGDARVKVNSVCPGWVKTDMGGREAERELPEGAAGIVWAATLPDDGPTGGFFRDGERIDW